MLIGRICNRPAQHGKSLSCFGNGPANRCSDLDLRPENLPPGTRLQVGSAIIEVTDGVS